MAAKTLTTPTTADETETATGTASASETALGVAQGVADDLAMLLAEFDAFKNDVSEALGNFRSASPEEFAKLGEKVERLFALILPND